MRLVRGRAADPAEDRAVTASLLADAASTGEPALRVWTPHRQVAFGRRDVREARFEAATRAAAERDYRAVERSVGGRAVAYTGETTLAFAHAVPVGDGRTGLDDRYEAATGTVLRALGAVGAAVRRGEPEDAFCPGQHSVRADGDGDRDWDGTGNGEGGDGKLAGVAQRVRKGAALVAGCVLVAERDELRDVLSAVYGELGAAFDPTSVGTVAGAGGPDDPETVRRALEDAFADGATTTVERVRGD
jgi:lipoate-protein ligase A